MKKSYTSQYIISKPLGNNALSFSQRKKLLGHTPTLTIPSLRTATSIDQIQLGAHVVFEEVDEQGKLHSCTGIVHLYRRDSTPISPTIYIMDNHHHALFFRLQHRRTISQTNHKQTHIQVLHIDAHADLGDNSHTLDTTRLDDDDYLRTFTNHYCQIGNFISPFVDATSNECIQIRSSSKLLSYTPDTSYILDIDLDFRALETTIPDDHLIRLQQLISNAKLVTIATSPYFLDQHKALHFLQQILGTTH